MSHGVHRLTPFCLVALLTNALYWILSIVGSWIDAHRAKWTSRRNDLLDIVRQTYEQLELVSTLKHLQFSKKLTVRLIIQSTLCMKVFGVATSPATKWLALLEALQSDTYRCWKRPIVSYFVATLTEQFWLIVSTVLFDLASNTLFLYVYDIVLFHAMCFILVKTKVGVNVNTLNKVWLTYSLTGLMRLLCRKSLKIDQPITVYSRAPSTVVNEVSCVCSYMSMAVLCSSIV